MILAGHGRWEAAKHLGLTHVPVLRVGHLTPAQARAYLIADNKIAEEAKAQDRQLLHDELIELSDLLPQRLRCDDYGFDVSEIDPLVADMASAKPEPEDVFAPATQKPRFTARRFLATGPASPGLRRRSGSGFDNAPDAGRIGFGRLS